MLLSARLAVSVAANADERPRRDITRPGQGAVPDAPGHDPGHAHQGLRPANARDHRQRPTGYAV
ncbi:hypothetical protein ACFMPD_09470 [Sedimentitalea sp. HM32M-2]|uniref:hypothetical protein n=1 Tax=Sedimentitalea sp. HM32M-2 TaxID=3351566 RepID=UPI003626D98F